MSIEFFQAEGNQRATRVCTITGANTLTVISVPGGVAVGDILVSTVGANAGQYTITDITGLTITHEPASDGVTGFTGSFRFQLAVKRAAIAITDFPATNQIEATGAGFTGGPGTIEKNDRVIINSGANAGAYYVDSIIDTDTISVRPLTGTPDVSAAPVPAGETVQIRRGYHFARIDEAVTDWNEIRTAGVAAPGPGVGDFGAGVGADFIDEFITADLYTAYKLRGCGSFQVINQACTWTSTNELVYQERDAVEAAAINPDQLILGVQGSSGNTLTLFLGSIVGDRFASSSGSVWIGFALPLEDVGGPLDNVNVVGIGSYIVHRGIQTNVATVLTTSVIRGILDTDEFIVEGGSYESLNIYGGEFLPEAPTPVFSGNLNHGGQSSTLSMITGAMTLEGYRRSDNVPTQPFILAAGDLFTLKNLTVHEPIENLIDPNAGAALDRVGFLSYDFTPRFLLREFDVITPLEGILVSLENDTILGPVTFTGRTDVNGRINGGLPLEFVAQQIAFFLVPDAVNILNVRMRVSGVSANGTRIKELVSVFELEGPFTGDIFLTPLRIDFEGELSES